MAGGGAAAPSPPSARPHATAHARCGEELFPPKSGHVPRRLLPVTPRGAAMTSRCPLGARSCLAGAAMSHPVIPILPQLPPSNPVRLRVRS